MGEAISWNDDEMGEPVCQNDDEMGGEPIS